MQLIQACTSILDQLEGVVRQISETDFSRPSPSLSGSTVGQHLRHTLEFFVCLQNGFDAGVVNYDKRPHDKLVETDKFLALSTIGKVKDFVTRQTGDRLLKLEVGYQRHTEEYVTISSTYQRELTYNIEHAVHHMALIKIGVREVAGYIKLPSDFGIAVSTIRYQETIPHSH